MISNEMEQSLNLQINREMYSAYLYLGMSAYCSGQDMDGMANWFRVQYEEEMFHSMKMYRYVFEQDGTVELLAIDKPPQKYIALVDVFAETLKHERMVTGYINELMSQAHKENDYATVNFLQWYINEQVEEEATAKSLLQQVKMVGDNAPGLLMLDRELAMRVFTPPAQ